MWIHWPKYKPFGFEKVTKTLLKFTVQFLSFQGILPSFMRVIVSDKLYKQDERCTENHYPTSSENGAESAIKPAKRSNQWVTIPGRKLIQAGNVREDPENEIWQTEALTVKFLTRHPLHVKPVPVLGTVGTNKTKNVRARVKELMKTGSGFRAPGELCVVVILDASTIPWSSPSPSSHVQPAFHDCYGRRLGKTYKIRA